MASRQQTEETEAQASAPKRGRWLWRLVYFVFLMGILGWAGYLAFNWQQRTLAGQITALGGKVRYQKQGLPIAHITLQEYKSEVFDVQYANYFFRIEKFTASPDTTDADLAKLAQLTYLSDLSLSGTAITNNGLLELSKLTRLRSLNLSRLPIDGHDFDMLLGLSRLETLDLEQTQVDDACLVHVGQLSSLKQLYLSHTRVTDDGLKQLEGLTHLEQLQLDGTPVTDQGLASVGQLNSLQHLSLNGTQVTDNGLAHLRHLAGLDLQVQNTRVSAAGLQAAMADVPRTEVFGYFKMETITEPAISAGFCGRTVAGAGVRNEVIIATSPGVKDEQSQRGQQSVLTKLAWTKSNIGSFHHLSLPQGQYLIFLRRGNFVDWRWITLENVNEQRRRLDYEINDKAAGLIEVTLPTQDADKPITFLPLERDKQGRSNEDFPVELGVVVESQGTRAVFQARAGTYLIASPSARTRVLVRHKAQVQVNLAQASANQN